MRAEAKVRFGSNFAIEKNIDPGRAHLVSSLALSAPDPRGAMAGLCGGNRSGISRQPLEAGE